MGVLGITVGCEMSWLGPKAATGKLSVGMDHPALGLMPLTMPSELNPTCRGML